MTQKSDETTPNGAREESLTPDGQSASKSCNTDENAALDAAFHAKLAESGLDDPSIIARYGFKRLTQSQVSHLSKHYGEIPAIKIPYASEFAPEEKFFRLRYLPLQQKIEGFGGVGTKALKQKYTQPAGAKPRFYFPATPPKKLTWRDVASDPAKKIIFTEGEFKAAKAMLEGFHCIGLGGVWNWKDKDRANGVIADFDLLKWERRPVYLVFDSDSFQNSQVAKALQALARELSRRGAIPIIAPLPDVYSDGRKTGVDDFLVHRGAEDFDAVLARGEVFGETKELWDLNERFVFIRSANEVFDYKGFVRHNPASFKNLLLNRTVTRECDGKVRSEQVANLWMSWPLRQEADKIDSVPGTTDRIVSVNEGLRPSAVANIWQGWGCEPTASKDYTPSSVAPWRDLLFHIFKGHDPDAEVSEWWFERWLAYPLQNPGAKLLSACLFWGHETGSGKSTLGVTMGEIYGVGIGYASMKASELCGQFNSIMAGKCFIQCDEVSTSKSDAETLKDMITRKTITINEKNCKEMLVSNRFNLLLTNNHPNAIHIDEYDRRFFVQEVEGVLPWTFWNKYYAWLEGAGKSHLFRYFLDLDIEGVKCPSPSAYHGQVGWSPHLPPPNTAAKQAAKEATRSGVEAWFIHFVESIQTDELSGDLWTPELIAARYRRDTQESVDPRRVGRVLHKLKCCKVSESVRVSGNAVRNVYALKNAARWDGADSWEIAEAFGRWHKATAPFRKSWDEEF